MNDVRDFDYRLDGNKSEGLISEKKFQGEIYSPDDDSSSKWKVECSAPAFTRDRKNKRRGETRLRRRKRVISKVRVAITNYLSVDNYSQEQR